MMQALVRTIEGSIRTYVASKKQAEVLGLRKEIVEYVKEQVDHTLENWGYHLQDLQINDITFDKVILDSMSKVVASNNLKAAAENEGQALLITKTKAAEAEGNAIKISAEAEKEAARLRGQGVSGQQPHRIADCSGLWGALEPSRAAVPMTSGIPRTVAIGIPIWHQRCGRPDQRTPLSNSTVNCGYSPDLTASIYTMSGRSN